MILSDREIAFRSKMGMITPFLDSPVSEVDGRGVISYGVTSYGYDARVSNEFKVFVNTYPLTVVDPKKFDSRAVVDITVDELILPPNSFALGRTVERFKIPRDILVVCIGKSTYARCGLIVNITPLEPEWEGYVTIEISNTTPLPARVYAFEGICQLIFLKASLGCGLSYKDKKGKYQNQVGITLPKV